MIEWVQRARYRWRWRKVAPAAVAVVQQGSGFVARTWPVPLTAASEGWAELLPDVLPWLTGQTAQLATPYGWSQASIMLALVHRPVAKRTLLWKAKLPLFERSEREKALTSAGTQLSAVPFADYPTATHLEVYLLDMGRILRHAFESIEQP